MARGALVNLKSGIVESVCEAASGLDLKYTDDHAFVPDETAQIGDAWDAKLGFNYTPANAEPSVDNLKLAMAQAGLKDDLVAEIFKSASSM